MSDSAGPSREAANPAFFATIGEEGARTGVPLANLMPELPGQGFLDLLDEVYRTGQPYTGRDVQVELGTGPLPDILDGMARCIEDLTPDDVLVSVLLADPDGQHLRHGAAPSLPGFYNEAIDGIATGEGVGSCGTAAHRREPVIVTDITTDPFWDDFRDLAGRAGLAACWSTPILARDGALLGTFAMYHRTPRVPKETDLALAGSSPAPRPWPSSVTRSKKRRSPPRPVPRKLTPP